MISTSTCKDSMVFFHSWVETQMIVAVQRMQQPPDWNVKCYSLRHVGDYLASNLQKKQEHLDVRWITWQMMMRVIYLWWQSIRWAKKCSKIKTSFGGNVKPRVSASTLAWTILNLNQDEHLLGSCPHSSVFRKIRRKHLIRPPMRQTFLRGSDLLWK